MAPAGAVRQAGGARPAGLVNLGNSCYISAVLQAMFGLSTLVAELHRAAAVVDAAGAPHPVLSALLECAEEHGAGGSNGPISPAAIKRAMGVRVVAFHGGCQQDAHEFFAGLLFAVQAEVLGAEVAALGRRRLCVSQTADPATRLFGLAVEHQLQCGACGAVSSAVEQFTHLSLELPGGGGGGGGGREVVPRGIDAMLGAYFADEAVVKACEACGAGGATPHRLRHRVRRLPRVLALHIKRFLVEPSPGGALATRKLPHPVALSEGVRLDPHCLNHLLGHRPAHVADFQTLPICCISTRFGLARVAGFLMAFCWKRPGPRRWRRG